MRAFIVPNYENRPKCKQSTIGRKFSQSGHPGTYLHAFLNVNEILFKFLLTNDIFI
jgi:hypothetical protein